MVKATSEIPTLILRINILMVRYGDTSKQTGSLTYTKLSDMFVGEKDTSGNSMESNLMIPVGGGRVELKVINFDWDSPDPRISFRDSKILAFDGSIGYGIGGGRVELEVGYEKFKTKGVKKGEGEEEGIYLLAKDLAYNVALDQTSQLTEGIKQLTKKNMHDVSNAINILDPYKNIDKGICKTGTNDWNDASSTGDNKGSRAASDCATKATTPGATPGLVAVMSEANQPTSNGQFIADTKLSTIPKTSAVISGDISALNREQKGVVSSAFAKAHEGAEIVEIRSNKEYA